MKKNNIVILLSLILLAGILLKIYSRTEKRITYFGNFKDKFCLNEICMHIVDGDWVYDENGMHVPVDGELANIYKDRFSSYELVDIVSNNKDKFVEYGFDGVPLILMMNNKKLEIGKAKDDLTGSYVRKVNGKVVYFAPGINFDKAEMMKKDYWNKKHVLNLADSMAKTIKIKNSKTDKIYTPKNNTFINDDLTGNLLRMRVLSFLGNSQPQNIKEKMEIEIELVDKKITMEVGATEDNRFWATTDKKFYFEISKDKYDKLTEMLK